MKLKKLIFEAIGTFLLTFAVGMSIHMIQFDNVKDLSNMKGLSFFMVYMFLFPVGRTISGCHLNPIISFAMFFIKKIDIVEMVSYMIAQILAAVASSLF